MDKEHSKKFKTMRTLLKKKSQSIVKVEKKLKKRKNNLELMKLRNNLVFDLQQQKKMSCEQERLYVTEIGCQERSFYMTLAAGIKPVITEELVMFREVEQLGEVMEQINTIIFDPNKNKDEANSVVNFVNTSQETFWFATPPSTPGGSLMGSRTGSLRSINSFSIPSSEASSESESEDQGTDRSASLQKYREFGVCQVKPDLNSM